jgi:hypothetical protein
LFWYIAHLSESVATFFPESGIKLDGSSIKTVRITDEEITNSLRTCEESHVYFMELLFSYMFAGNPFRTLFIPIDEAQSAHRLLSEEISTQAGLFIVAHVYAHLALGHTGDKGIIAERKLLGEIRVNEITKSWKEELDADNPALQLIMRGYEMDGLSLALNYLGVDFFFTCAGVIEKAANLTPSKTHPPAALGEMHCVITFRGMAKSLFPSTQCETRNRLLLA